MYHMLTRLTSACDLAKDYEPIPELVKVICCVNLSDLGVMFNIMNVPVFAHTLFSSSYIIGVHCCM